MFEQILVYLFKLFKSCIDYSKNYTYKNILIKFIYLSFFLFISSLNEFDYIVFFINKK